MSYISVSPARLLSSQNDDRFDAPERTPAKKKLDERGKRTNILSLSRIVMKKPPLPSKVDQCLLLLLLLLFLVSVDNFCVNHFLWTSNEPLVSKPIHEMNLMPGPRIYRPGMWSMFRSLFNGELMMKRNIDPNFTWVDFMKGATQAASLVSNRIADGNFYELRGMVTPEAIEEIKDNISKMGMTERERIRINDNQILFKWANSSDFSGGGGSPWRVSIMTVYHTLPGHHNRYASSLKEFEQLAKAVVRISNIRFTAQFVDGDSDGWVIDYFNSFDDDSNYPPMKKQS